MSREFRWTLTFRAIYIYNWLWIETSQEWTSNPRAQDRWDVQLWGASLSVTRATERQQTDTNPMLRSTPSPTNNLPSRTMHYSSSSTKSNDWKTVSRSMRSSTSSRPSRARGPMKRLATQYGVEDINECFVANGWHRNSDEQSGVQLKVDLP